MESTLIEELKKTPGPPWGPVVMEVERGALKRYVEAVGDDNPLFRDADYAKQAGYQDILCPPGFFGWPVRGGALLSWNGPMLSRVGDLARKANLKRIVFGGEEYEFFTPLKPGDKLVCQGQLTDLFERMGRSGRLLFAVFELTYSTQEGQLVAKCRSTFILSSELGRSGWQRIAVWCAPLWWP